MGPSRGDGCRARQQGSGLDGFGRRAAELVTICYQFAASILSRLAEIDKTLLVHDSALREVYRKLLPLLAQPPDRPKREIGFHVKP